MPEYAPMQMETVPYTVFLEASATASIPDATVRQ